MTLGDGTKWDTISAMTDCNNVVPLKKGDSLTMKAIYDLKKHPLYVLESKLYPPLTLNRRENHGGGHAEQMGLMTFSFVPN